MTARPIRFRLYPESRRGLYVAVHVWPTAKAMRQQASGRLENRVQGYCHPYKRQRYDGSRWRTYPVVADVHFYRGRLSMRVVTHELFHATIAWARRVRFDFTRLDAHDSINDDEERLAYAHDALCRTFMVRAQQLGLYDKGLAA